MHKKLIIILCTIALIAVALPAAAVNAQTPVLDHVVITPASVNLLFEATQQFTASGQDVDNATIDDLTYTWEVVNGGGTIDEDGLFTAGTTAGAFADTVKVTAVQGEVSVTAVATVGVFEAAGALDHVVISPVTVTLAAGATQQFTVEAHDVNELPVTVDVVYSWEVVNEGGTITDAGLFTADNKAGTYTDTVKVTAICGEITKSALATVIVNVEPKKDKTVFTPFGWLQGLKKGWNSLPFPPGWYKNGKATQSGDEVTTIAPQGKGLQNKNMGNKNK